MRTLFEIIPLAVFFAINMALHDLPLAIASLMGLSIISLIIIRVKEREWPVMLMVGTGFILAFGLPALLFPDAEWVFKIKPTVANLFFAIVLALGMAFKRNLLTHFLGKTLNLDDATWDKLLWRWVGFFILMAVLNEIVWRNFSTEFWAGFKLFGLIPLSLVFAALQAPLIKKGMRE